jgi:mono/diheme cytochrome c family protein
MDKKLSTSVILATTVFALALLLYVVVIISLNGVPSEAQTSNAVTSHAPQQQEINHPGQKLFKTNCTPCHRINQKLVGPALVGVLDRRDSLWVVKMIRNSSKLIASGDPTAVKLFEEYNRTQMTAFTSFSDEDLRNLLEYLKLESARQSAPSPSGAGV